MSSPAGLAGLHASSTRKHTQVLRSQAVIQALPHFVDALPVPAVLQPTSVAGGVALYDIRIGQFQQRLHRDLPLTTLWGYNGTSPGPTIEAQGGKIVKIRYTNVLPPTPLTPTDPIAMDGMAGMAMSMPTPVSALTHLHGSHATAASDGNPGGSPTINPGQSTTFTYPNLRREGMNWYHDHTLGYTRVNVNAGLAGMYFLRKPGGTEDGLNLPKGKYEVPLMLQDRTLDANGQLVYPQAWAPETFGDVALVNGKAWPFFKVEPRKYRLRILNASNARFYHLTLSNNRDFKLIGTDSRMLGRAVVTPDLTVAPAERADVIVDFSGLSAGSTVTLQNDGAAPYPDGGDVALPELMQFQVGAPGPRDTSSAPDVLDTLESLDAPAPSALARVAGPVKRDFVLKEYENALDEPIKLLINDQPYGSPITDKPKLGSVEEWSFINTTGDTHPMHVHLVDFQILDRRPFDAAQYLATGQVVFTGPAVKPGPAESGFKDTVRSGPGEVTRVRMRFTDFSGVYMLHCHILEHEENDMMRLFEVVQ